MLDVCCLAGVCHTVILNKQSRLCPPPLLNHSLALWFLQVLDFVAHVTLVQVYRNSESDPIECVYTFPVDSSAAVNSIRMRVGDRLIEGTVQEKVRVAISLCLCLCICLCDFISLSLCPSHFLGGVCRNSSGIRVFIWFDFLCLFVYGRLRSPVRCCLLVFPSLFLFYRLSAASPLRCLLAR